MPGYRHILGELGRFDVVGMDTLPGPAFVDLEQRVPQTPLECLGRDQVWWNHGVSVFVQMIGVASDPERLKLLSNLPVMPGVLVLFKAHGCWLSTSFDSVLRHAA